MRHAMNNVDTPEQVLNLVDEDYEQNHPIENGLGGIYFCLGISIILKN